MAAGGSKYAATRAAGLVFGAACAGARIWTGDGAGGGGGGAGSTGLMGRRNAASSRCAISARLLSSFCVGLGGTVCARLDSVMTVDWNAGE
jgi:hypothetical protein